MKSYLNKTVFVDTETTSLNKNEAEIIEIGLVYFKDGKEIIEGHLFCPEHSNTIASEVSAVNNITYEMVCDKPHFKDFNLTDRIKDKEYIVCHNVAYDRPILEKYSDYSDFKWICTYKLARKLFGNDDSVTNFKMSYLFYRFDLYKQELNESVKTQFHRASYDAYICYVLFKYLVDYMIENNIINKDKNILEQVYNYSNSPVKIKKMPFGKHKGKELKEVPISYWQWAIKNLDIFDENSDNYDRDFCESVLEVLN